MTAISVKSIMEWLSNFNLQQTVDNQSVIDHFDFDNTGAVEVGDRVYDWHDLLIKMHVFNQGQLKQEITKQITRNNIDGDYDNLTELSKIAQKLKSADDKQIYHLNYKALTYADLIDDLHWLLVDNGLNGVEIDVTPNRHNFDEAIIQSFDLRIHERMKRGVKIHD